MKDHLMTKGWPDNLDANGILMELPNLWQKLAAEGLLEEAVSEGLTYQHFCDIARGKAVEAQMMADVEAFFRRQGR